MSFGGDNRVRIRAELEDEVSRGLKKIDGGFSQLAKSPGAQTILQGVGMGAGVSAWGLLDRAAAGVVDTVFDSIRAASDMNETVSKAGVVFGEASDKVVAFGDRAAASMGISKQAAIDAASGFGQFFQGAGQAADSAEQMSERMVGLAADLASFNNLDPTDVLAKLKSGLSGEAEPLRALGVFLTEDKVKAKALELGLADAHGEVSEGSKIISRYQLILDSTKDAQGDFSRTADGAANSQRILNAELEDAKAKLGQGLLPLEKAWIDLQLGVVDALSENLTWTQYVAKAQEKLGTTSKGAEGKVFALAASMRAVDEAAKDSGATLDLLDRHMDRGADSAGDLAAALFQVTGLLDTIAGIDFEDAVLTPKQRRRMRAIGRSGIGRASGGPVPAGWDFWAGEGEGPELVRLTAGGGAVVASPTQSSSIAGGAGGGGQPAQINLVVDGRVLARLIDERLYYRAQRAPS